MSSLAGKSVLVTGATGSFGKEFLRQLLDKNEIEQITVFSRDELKQFEMRTEFDSPEVDNEVLVPKKDSFIRLGDFAMVKITDATEYDLMGELI